MNWKQQLKRKYLDNLQQKRPDFFQLSGGFKMRVKPYSDSTRSGLIRSVIDWINFSGGSAKEVVKGYLKKQGTELVWINAPGKRHAADIVGVFKSHPLEIIVRLGAQKSISPSAGGVQLIIGCFQDFVEWWNDVSADIPITSDRETNPTL